MYEMTMVERATIAALNEMARQAGVEPVGRQAYITSSGTISFACREIVVAVMKSMRDPPQAIIDTIEAEVDERCDGFAVWNAGIDAALAEEPRPCG